jgi:uncharacterized membrane protein
MRFLDFQLAAIATFRIPRDAFWVYFSGAVLLAIGLPIILRNGLLRTHGPYKIALFGRLFFAIPMAVFGTEHLTDASDIARIVPPWMPAHLFWTYLVGIALITAAVSIVIDRHAQLAATLLGAMLLLFVILIHLPNVISTSGDRFFWTIALRDIAFSGGALALAGSHMRRKGIVYAPRFIAAGRFFVGIPAIVFGIEYFLYTDSAPGVPLKKVIPMGAPERLFLAYFAGIILFAAGTLLITNKKALSAAICLGIVIFVLTLFVYLPIVVSSPADIGNALNYFFDTLAFSGAALALAEALKEPLVSQPWHISRITV